MAEETNGAISLDIDGTTYPLDRVKSTDGSDGIVVASLLGSTGLVTVDPGFVNTASCTSKVTYIDGGAGILRYRGYPIEQLAEQSLFLEVAYLLIYGELPSKDEFDNWRERILRHTYLHEDFREFFAVMPRNAHPMSVLAAGVQIMAAFYPESIDPLNEKAAELATILLLAKMPTMVSYVHRRAAGYPLLYPRSSDRYVQNFARLTFARPGEDFEPNEALIKALNLLLILHADHEQNCSTSTVRMVGSANASLYASIAGGVAALSGPLHGGANEAVIDMLTELRDTGVTPQEFMTKVKNKAEGVKLMGFGHRVYKNYDPRAAIVKKAADDVLTSLGIKDDLLDLAMEVEDIALNDDYFIERKLYPNVDFYTGIIYKAMGFPSSMFTPLFALGRLPGWIAQWREMMHDPAKKIARPRQVYQGAPERNYVPIDQR